MLTAKTLKFIGVKSGWKKESFSEIIAPLGTDLTSYDALMDASYGMNEDLWAFGDASDFLDSLSDFTDEFSIALAESIASSGSEYIMIDFRDRGMTKPLEVSSSLYSVEVSGTWSGGVEGYVRMSSLADDTPIGYVTRSDMLNMDRVEGASEDGDPMAQLLTATVGSHPDWGGWVAFDF